MEKVMSGIHRKPQAKIKKRRARALRDERRESGLAADKWVRIMCDFSADGVWARTGGAAMPEDLPVSVGLHKRIRAWQDWYERHARPDPEFSSAPPGFGIDAFSSEGLAIAKAVKAELPDWTVVYHDEARAEPQYREPYVELPRSCYEYEV
jgi:hypothetical protein